ncbi:SIR2 family protein [Citrobacter koseri]|uniref:SIR2 family protein n=1 Tax=Citrobacter koseri TaxID=545 RepID=UPI0030C21ABF
MSIEYADKNDFIIRISNTKDISFVFGSALTGLKDGIGILEPAGVVKFIEKRMVDAGYQEKFKQHLEKNNEIFPYQAAFEFIAKYYGPDEINNIITDIVSLNEDSQTKKQKIPSTVKEFVKIVKENRVKIKYIITTNFDTLIEEALASEGIPYNSLSIVQDSNINDNANDLITVVHIHGIWNRGDTMHTRNQLERRRERIEESLRNIVEKGPLCVMAYGGWEDSFTRMLSSLLKNNESKYSLIWCFYPDNDGVIDREYQHIHSMLEDAISRERVQFYKGIDCRTIFHDINAEVISAKKH